MPRIETDSLGPVEVPDAVYWGAQTQRSIDNFPFGPMEQMPPGIRSEEHTSELQSH